MSYEGYSQLLCKNGHYWTVDCWNSNGKQKCPTCGERQVWENSVDITNGSFDDDGTRIDGYIALETETIKKCDHCNSILEIKCKIPEKS